jgi:hypothetical protein
VSSRRELPPKVLVYRRTERLTDLGQFDLESCCDSGG